MLNDRWQKVVNHIRANQNDSSNEAAICTSAVEILAVDAVSISLVVNRSYSPISSSDDLAHLLDEMQFSFGNGPTFDAQKSVVPLIIEDIYSKYAVETYPAFMPRAQELGIQGIYAFPLRIGNAFIGVLTAYRKSPAVLSADQLANGLILASIATAEIVDRQAGLKNNDVLNLFEPGLREQSVLQVAAGMVAEYLNISVIEGLVLIRARAFAEDVPVTRIAQKIVSREIQIEK